MWKEREDKDMGWRGVRERSMVRVRNDMIELANGLDMRAILGFRK